LKTGVALVYRVLLADMALAVQDLINFSGARQRHVLFF
jgi:hypothetical protein